MYVIIRYCGSTIFYYYLILRRRGKVCDLKNKKKKKWGRKKTKEVDIGKERKRGDREGRDGVVNMRRALSTMRLWWDQGSHLICQAHKVNEVGPVHAWRFHREGHFYMAPTSNRKFQGFIVAVAVILVSPCHGFLLFQFFFFPFNFEIDSSFILVS